MKKLFVLICLLIFSCKTKQENIFEIIDFNGQKVEPFVDKMMKEGRISYFREDYSENKIYKSSIEIRDSILPVYLKFNVNKYDFNVLKHVEIYYNSDPFIGFSDSVSESKYIALKYHINENLGRIKDTVINKNENLFFKKRKDTVFHLEYDEKDFILKNKEPLIIRSKNYLQEIKKTKDSLIKNQTIKNLLKLSHPYVSWEVKRNNLVEFSLDGGYVVKQDKYEFRTIKSIRFKVFIKDEFNEILHVTTPITFELPIKIDDKIPAGVTYDINRAKFKLNYDKNNYRYESLEKARLYRDQNSVKIESEILAIAFEDGTVLKK
jgi:hypothetical protein